MNITISQVIAREAGIILFTIIVWAFGIYSHRNDIPPNEAIILPKPIGLILGKPTNPYSISGIALQIFALITFVVLNLPLFNIITIQTASRIYIVLVLILGIVIGTVRIVQSRKLK